VLVEFKGHRRELFNNPSEFPFRVGDIAIVESERGQDAGEVKCVLTPSESLRGDDLQYSVIRRALEPDLQRILKLRENEVQALQVCREKTASHNLPMKLVDVEYRFDGLKLTFFFTAEGRVDFRELVRDLAGTFHTRIELRQIGARDDAKRGDSYGVCGKRLCCITFLNSFRPITTHMAKTQNLILNPSKLSGRCGRLKCCLAFEYEDYTEQQTAEPLEAIREHDEHDDSLDQMSD